MQIKSNWMIAVITGFWQTCLFFFYQRVLSSQASGCVRHHHRPFIDHYGNGDNLFVRCPLYALLGRYWESAIPTFRLLLLTFPNLVISCVVLFLCWLKSMWSCLGVHFAEPWPLLLSFHPNWQVFWAPGHVRTVWQGVDLCFFIQVWHLIFYIHSKNAFIYAFTVFFFCTNCFCS